MSIGRRIVPMIVLAAITLSACGSTSAKEGVYTAPDVMGMTVDQAKAAMDAANVPLYFVRDSQGNPLTTLTDDGIVNWQDPEAHATGSGAMYVRVDEPKKDTGIARHDADNTLEYRVYGPGSASITWFDANGQTRQNTSAATPWSASLSASGGYGGGNIFGVWAQDMSGTGGAIGCEIQYNGAVVSSNESTGPYAVVECHTTLR